MASITIRKLDDAVKVKLRIRAAQHGHSMEEEAREIINKAVAKPESTDSENPFLSIRKLMAEAGIKGVNLPEISRSPMRKPPAFD